MEDHLKVCLYGANFGENVETSHPESTGQDHQKLGMKWKLLYGISWCSVFLGEMIAYA
jgi:hypothetical protein